MKVYRELRIDGTPEKLAQFPDLATRVLGANWNRDTESETNLRRAGGGGQSMYCFSPRRAGIPASKLWISPKDDYFYVSNIVPIEVGRLSRDQYNAIVKQFGDDLAELLVLEPEIQISLSEDEKGPADLMPADVAEKLHRFSILANKSTGSSHPMDRERWFDFIMSLVDSGTPLAGEKLKGLLVEDEGWDPETADELASEYSTCREFLEAYLERTRQ